MTFSCFSCYFKLYEKKQNNINYLLTSSTNPTKGFSHPYIFITRIPEMTSFIVRILSSVRTAVSALKQQGAMVANGTSATETLERREKRILI